MCSTCYSFLFFPAHTATWNKWFQFLENPGMGCHWSKLTWQHIIIIIFIVRTYNGFCYRPIKLRDVPIIHLIWKHFTGCMSIYIHCAIFFSLLLIPAVRGSILLQSLWTQGEIRQRHCKREGLSKPNYHHLHSSIIPNACWCSQLTR